MIHTMPNTSNFSHPQDDLGAVLSTPLGTANVAPRRPEPIGEPSGGLPTTSTATDADRRASKYDRSIDAQLGGGRRLVLVLGSAVLAACTALGLLAWLR